MKTEKKRVLFITQAAAVAAMYVVLTEIATLMGLSSGAVQVRFSEALTILPYFIPSAIPGLFIGCIISNLLAGAVIWDVIFGSLATLAAACVTYLIRRAHPILASVPPIVANTVVVPIVLRLAYGVDDAWYILVGGVLAGEVISCGILGTMLLYALKSRNLFKRS